MSANIGTRDISLDKDDLKTFFKNHGEDWTKEIIDDLMSAVTDDDYEKLEDENVRTLVDSLKQNDEFSGPLDLSENDLSDLVSYKFYLT